MASIRSRKDTGLLLLDFRFRGERCREQTLLQDTPGNRERLQKLADRIERAIGQGCFIYADFFPNSPRAKKAADSAVASALEKVAPPAAAPITPSESDRLPTLSEFAEVWFRESEPRWRKQHRACMRDVLDKLFIPFFSDKRIGEVTRADVLGFRAELAKRPGRRGQSLSGKSINKRVTQLKAIINEACDRYGLPSPARGIKALKQRRSEIHPFSVEEVDLLISKVRSDYQPYLTVRCLTGLRTGEANGLQWSDIDFAQNTFRIERTLSRDGDGETKTEFSKREIPMVLQVREAFEEQRKRKQEGCDWVFHSPRGNPIDAVNFTNRVWYPLLRHLGLKQRPPYQMRHTAATLMLASGENPEWVARMLGHSTTEMLFRIYSRFVPNLTRNDGRAYAQLLATHSAARNSSAERTSPSQPPDLSTLSRAQLEAMVRGLDTASKEDNHVS
jgi:integrase